MTLVGHTINCKDKTQHWQSRDIDIKKNPAFTGEAASPLIANFLHVLCFTSLSRLIFILLSGIDTYHKYLYYTLG